MRLHRTAEKIIQNDSARRKFKKFVYISKLYKNLKKEKETVVLKAQHNALTLSPLNALGRTFKQV